MIHKTKLTWLTAGVLVAFGFFPAAAVLAESGSSSGSSGSSAGVEIEIELDDDSDSDDSTNTSTSTNSRGDDDDNDDDSTNTSTSTSSRGGDDDDDDDDNVGSSNRGGSATSTLNRQDSDRRSGQSLRDDDDDDSDEDEDDEIEVRRDEARNASSTVDRPEKVSNRGQLRSFLNHVVKGDDRIVDVNVSSTTIETQYVMPARFLWAIPLDLTTDVKIGSDGTVTVTYPWYAFLFSKKSGDDLESELTAAASTTVSTTTPTSFSASLQARLLNAFFAALKGSSDE